MSKLDRLIESFRSKGGHIYKEGEIRTLDRYFRALDLLGVFGCWTPLPSFPPPLNYHNLPDKRFETPHHLIWMSYEQVENKLVMGHELGHWIDEINKLACRKYIERCGAATLSNLVQLRPNLFQSEIDRNYFSQPKEIWAEMVSISLERENVWGGAKLNTPENTKQNSKLNTTNNTTNNTPGLFNKTEQVKEQTKEIQEELQEEINRYIDKLL